MAEEKKPPVRITIHRPASLLVIALKGWGRALRWVEGKKDAVPGKENDDVIVSIVFAWAALDAFISTLIDTAQKAVSGKYDWACAPKEDGGSVEAAIVMPEELVRLGLIGDVLGDRISVVEKYKATKLALTGEPFTTEQAPWQTFKSLGRLRNAVVHLKPEEAVRNTDGTWVHDAPNVVEGYRHLLASGYGEGPLGSSWFSAIHTPAIAGWACGVAYDMMKLMIQAMPEGWQEMAGITLRGPPQAEPIFDS